MSGDTDETPNGELLAKVVGAKGAEELSKRCSTLRDMARLCRGELERLPGVGRGGAARLEAVFELSRRLQELKIPKIWVLEKPCDVAGWFLAETRRLATERIYVVSLNARRRVLSVDIAATGGLSSVAVEPREIFRPALAVGATSIILAHNHPSGDPTPSASDLQMTQTMCKAGQMIGVQVLDHLILGVPTGPSELGYVSLRERGVMG